MNTLKIGLTLILVIGIPFHGFSQSEMQGDGDLAKRNFGFGLHIFYPGEVDGYENGFGAGFDLLFFNESEDPTFLISGSYTGSYKYNENFGDLNLDSGITVYALQLGIALNSVFIPYLSASKAESDIDLSSSSGSLIDVNVSSDFELGGGLMLRLPFQNKSAITVKAGYNGSIEGFGGSLGIQF